MNMYQYLHLPSTVIFEANYYADHSKAAFIFVIITPDVHEYLVRLEDIAFGNVEACYLVGGKHLDHFLMELSLFFLAALSIDDF